MALDPTLSLLTVRQHSFQLRPTARACLTKLADSVRELTAIRLHANGYATIGGSTQHIEGMAELSGLLQRHWLVLDAASRGAFAEALDRLRSTGGNAYDILERANVLLVASSSIPRLSGGSYASATLSELEGHLVVDKMVSRSVQPDPDADLRLDNERDWILSLPAAARRLFPIVRATYHTATETGYCSDLFPGYTMAERIFHGTASSADVRDLIGRVLAALRDNLYAVAAPSPASPAHDPYGSRLRRRFDRIWGGTTAGFGQTLRDAISADSIMVNGVRCSGLPRLLGALLTNNWIERFVRPGGTERAHGDLILDDIVVSRTGSFKLLDPSGCTHSRLYDIGKLCLSLLSYYEFFKYDRFEVTVDTGSPTTSIEIAIADDPARCVYAAVAGSLPDLIRQTRILDARTQLDGVGLLLLNAVQNLSLPMFHLLHHRNEKRALAFLAIGVLRLNQVAALLDLDRRPSIDEVCTDERFRPIRLYPAT